MIFWWAILFCPCIELNGGETVLIGKLENHIGKFPNHRKNCDIYKIPELFCLLPPFVCVLFYLSFVRNSFIHTCLLQLLHESLSIHMDHSSDFQGNPWKSISFPGCPSFPSPFLLRPSLQDDAPLIVFQEGSWTVWSVKAQGWTLLFALLASLMTVNLTSCNHCTHGCQRSSKTVSLSSSSISKLSSVHSRNLLCRESSK